MTRKQRSQILIESHESNPDSPSVEHSVLENGVRVCTEHVPGVRSISMSVIVGCGSRHDSGAESGLAHLCEHLLFQGTTGRSAVQIARQMDSAAGDVGAFTTRDYTCYYASVLDDYCFHALDLLGDVLLNSVFPESALEREKRVIANEIAQTEDTPRHRLNLLLKQRIWPGHPLGQPIAGDPRTLETFTREDVIYYFHRNYTPDRMIICASGNVKHEDFAAQTRDAFWRLIGQSEPIGKVPALPRGGVFMEPRSGGQTYFCFGIPAPCYTDPRRYQMHLLARILGGGISSRLFRALRETGLAYDASAEYEAYREGGLLVIEGSTAAEDLIETLSVTLDCIVDLISGKHPCDEEEVARAKTQIRAHHIIASQDVHTRMSRLGTQELYFDRDIPDREVLTALDQCTMDSLMRSAQNGLDLSQICLVVSGPAALANQIETMVERKSRNHYGPALPAAAPASSFSLVSQL